MVIGIDYNLDAIIDVNATPGTGDDTPGTVSYTSGGVINFSDVGIPNGLVANATTGDINVEFFESFVDVDGAVEGVYNQGSNITVQYALTCDGGAVANIEIDGSGNLVYTCLLYTSPSPRDKRQSRMPSSA